MFLSFLLASYMTCNELGADERWTRLPQVLVGWRDRLLVGWRAALCDGGGRCERLAAAQQLRPPPTSSLVGRRLRRRLGADERTAGIWERRRQLHGRTHHNRRIRERDREREFICEVKHRGVARNLFWWDIKFQYSSCFAIRNTCFLSFSFENNGIGLI